MVSNLLVDMRQDVEAGTPGAALEPAPLTVFQRVWPNIEEKRKGASVPGTNSYLTFDINSLILCDDSHFLGTMERVFARLGVRSNRSPDYVAALAALEGEHIDAVVVDWREIINLGEFLETMRRSKMNKHCLLIGIASNLLDLRQAFSAGVQFLIHKPASVVQIARCLQAAHSAVIVKRRKQHREPVRIAATLHTRSWVSPNGDACVQF